MFGIFKFLFTNLGQKSGYQNDTPLSQPIENNKPVGVDGALQIATVWQCLDLISRTFATLPLDILRRGGNGANYIDTKHHLNFIFNAPNKYMTSYEFWQYMCLSRELKGNAYALITRNSDGEIISLEPLNPDQVNVFIDENSNIIYTYYKDGEVYNFLSDQIIHWKGLGNGIIGLSVLDYMRTTVSETFYTQQNAVNQFAQKGSANGVLISDQILTPKQKAELKDGFDTSRFNGKTPVLDASLRYQQLSLSPADTQLLETRKFTTEEIKKWFGIPTTLLSESGEISQEVVRYFYQSKILPICVSAEQVLIRKLLNKGENLDYFCKFRLSTINRASDVDRATLNATYVQNGIKTRNEVRREEGWCDVVGGDTLTAQTNLAPLDQLGINNQQNSAKFNQLVNAPVKQ